MPKTRVTVTLDSEIEEWVRAGAEASGNSISQIIRLCLDEYMNDNPERFSRANKARSETEGAWLRPLIGSGKV